jgi:Asp-tRNA(Asn)/Glu-tRNA(Gln) amidotransferase A subunit family amidase
LVWRKALDALMQQEGIDLWISPPARGAAPRGLESTGDPVMNLPWTQAGLPTINLPAGTDSQGLPLGLQVTGRWGTDEALLSWAEELEGLVRRP